MNTQQLIERIKNNDVKVRADAWLHAEEVGAPALKPLATLLSDSDVEVSRAAKRAMWRIVRHAGRPGADEERKTVVVELAALLEAGQPAPVLREAMWMLSEIGDDQSVPGIGRFLADKDLREDARMTLQRIPGDTSLAALKAVLADADEEFKPAVAQSLRARGVEVPNVPSRKLVPTKKTNVKRP